MELKERTREWIHKPIFHGAPASWPRIYFRGRLKSFRKDHPEFDQFLNGLYVLLKQEKDDDYINICLFIGGEAEANWISPKDCLFDELIKLYNLCLSPKHAYEYIKQCHEWYIFMKKSQYKIEDNVNFSIRKSRLDGKYHKFIEVSVIPKKQPLDINYHYWFDVTTCLRYIEDDFNDILCHSDKKIKLASSNEVLNDALVLFEFNQNKPFLKNIFSIAINGLKKNEIIKEGTVEKFYDWKIHNFKAKFVLEKGEW